MEESELMSKFDSRDSFYGKATIRTEGKKTILKSYSTDVAEIDHKTNKVIVYGWFSQTTGRHINEFLSQNGFNTMTKKEMEK